MKPNEEPLLDGVISEEGNGWYSTEIGDSVICHITGDVYVIVERNPSTQNPGWESNWINVKVRRSCYDSGDYYNMASVRITDPDC